MSRINTSTENYNILLMKIDIGGQIIDFTYDSLYIPNKEQLRGLSNIAFNASRRPYFHRFQRYNQNFLSRLSYSEVIKYFFDRNSFPNILLPNKEKRNGQINDDIVRQNIYLTLFYLFPTGYPSVGSVSFSYNKIVDGGIHGYAPIGPGYSLPSETNMIKTGSNATNAIGVNPVPGSDQGFLSSFTNLFKPAKRYSYLKRDKTYTISEVVWKNDIYNHPVYKKLLTSVYRYISWGINYKKVKITIQPETTGSTVAKVTRIDKTIMEKRNAFIIELKKLIKYNKFVQISRHDEKNKLFIEMIIASNLFGYLLNELGVTDTSIKEEGSEVDTDQLTAIQTRMKKLIDLINSNNYVKNNPTYTKIKDEKINKKINYGDIESNLIDKLREDEEAIVNIYHSGFYTSVKDLREKMSYYYNDRVKSKKITFDVDNMLDALTKYVLMLDLKKALNDYKMIPIKKAENKGDKIYSKILREEQEISTISNLYNNEYLSFKKELGGEEGTNSTLNEIIQLFMNGEDNMLAYCALWYYDYVLQDHTLGLDDSIMDKIKSTVEPFNRDWEKIYTGIRTDFNMNATKTEYASSSNEYPIHLSMVLYDQELNDDTVEQFKCYLLNNSMGPMLEYLNSANASTETADRKKYMIQSVVKHIPSPNNKSLKDAAIEKKNSMTKKPVVPNMNQRQQLVRGGRTHRKRKRVRRTFKKVKI